MNINFDREFVAQIIITLAVCIGGWMMVVEPKARELAELEKAIAEVQSLPATGQENLTTLATRVESFRDRVRAIESQNTFARDSSKMYKRVMDLAASHGVTIQRLDPGAGSAKDKDGPVRATTFDMTVEGLYEHLATFMDAIAEMDGFVRPRMLSLTPRERNGQLVVEAHFVCDAVSFELPAVLMTMTQGADDAVE